MFRIITFFGATMLLMLFLVGANVSAQEPFPGSKTLISGPDPVGTGKDAPSVFILSIDLDAGVDSSCDIVDVLPAEFDVSATGVCSAGSVGDSCAADVDCDTELDALDGICTPPLSVSCGEVTASRNKGAGKGKQPKLEPEFLNWDLDAGTACAGDGSENLTIVVVTDLNPGHGKRGIQFYEPTSCGPLSLNDGAEIVCSDDSEYLPSDPIVVATCEDEADTTNCVDGDDDGWSVDCGDCDDTDPAVNPGAEELCEDEIDNNCDGQINEGCE